MNWWLLTKKDQDNKDLAGAGFTLEKKDSNGDWKTVKVIDADTTTTKFTFSGLDDGDYRLIESTTPSGYNTITPIEFTIKADHTIEWTKEKREEILTKLTGEDKATGTVQITFSSSETDGSLTTDIINKSGTTLPGTGGIGTTIFYVIGGGLIAIAAVLFITRKRMEKDK